MYTADLARYLVDAVDAPDSIIGKRINVGYDRPAVPYVDSWVNEKRLYRHKVGAYFRYVDSRSW